MTINDIRQLVEIFNSLITPMALIAVTAMQIINFVRAGHMTRQTDKIEKATNSMVARQEQAAHAAGVLVGVLEERARVASALASDNAIKSAASSSASGNGPKG